VADAKIGRAVLEITIDDKQYKVALGDIEKKTNATGDTLRKMSNSIDALVWLEYGKVAVAAIGAITQAVIDLADRGDQVSDVSSAFDNLSASVGSTGEAMLGSLRDGVLGSVSDFELMQIANKALGAGVVKSAEDMGTLARGAYQLAEATGGKTTDAMGALTKAIATGRTGMLAQYSLVVDASKATEAYAYSLGKSEKELTKQEKTTAVSIATMAALKARMEELGPPTIGFSEAVGQAKTGMTNLNDSIAKGIAESPVLAAGMKSLSEEFQRALGSDQKTIVSEIVRGVEALAIALTYVAQGGVAMATGFSMLLAGIATGVTMEVAKIADQVSQLAQSFIDVYNIAPKLFSAMTGGEAEKSVAALKSVRDGAGTIASTFGQASYDARKMGLEVVTAAGAINTALEVSRAKMMANIGAAAVEGAARVQTSNTTTDTIVGNVAKEDAARKAVAAMQQQLDAASAQSVTQGEAQKVAAINATFELRKSKIMELVGLDATAQAAMIAQADAIRAADIAKITDHSAQILAKETELRAAIVQATTSGAEQKAAALEAQYIAEVASLENLKVSNATAYAMLLALVQEKYSAMTMAANGHYMTLEQRAAAAGFKTREELQRSADAALAMYAQMLASGQYTEQALLDAKIAAEKAKQEAQGGTVKYTMTANQAILTGSQQILGVLGEKHKSAAIAGAIISTYAAVAKALQAAPWPYNLILAAGALAAGMANVNKIRSSQAGFAEGTPNLDFAGFGSMSMQPLHGNEAVIPQGKGHMLAGEIAGAMGEDGGNTALLTKLSETLEALPAAVARAIRNGQMQAAR